MDKTKIHSVNCLWCYSNNLSSQIVDKKTYFQCKHCEYLFLDPHFRLNAAAEKARYDLHENNVQDSGYQSFVMPLKNEITKAFGTDTIGLDYGSGADSAISFLLQKENYAVQKYDPFFNSDSSVLTAATYDFIIVCEVAEHFYAPAVEFEKINSYLKPNGLIFVMTSLLTHEIDFSTWSYRRDQTHVGFFSVKTFQLKYSTQVKSANLVILKSPPILTDSN